MFYLEENFMAAHCTDRGFTMPEKHCHDFYEIYLTKTDGVKYFVNDKIFSMNQNDMLVFNQHDLHHALVPADLLYDRYVITFKPDFIREFCTESENILACFENRKSNFCNKISLSDAQAQQLISCLEQNNGSDSFPILSKKLQLIKILILIHTFYQASRPTKQIEYSSKHIFEKINPILPYINNNLSQNLSLDLLSSKVYMDKYYFCKTFKKATGFTVNEYISLRRIMTATELLLEGKSISQVSELVGYKNDTYFITKFKSYWNVSPKQFVKLKNSKEFNSSIL